MDRPPRLLDQMREALRARHYSPRTERAYLAWVRRFIYFHQVRHPAEMGEAEINAFLTHLAVKEKVSASTQNQALAGLLFLYRHVLAREVGDLEGVVRARRSPTVPVVMTRTEVRKVLDQLSSDKWLIASLLYGCGLRLMEALGLRVKDLDFARKEVTVHEAKGGKSRVTVLPTSLVTPLQSHLRAVRLTHERDLADGWGRVVMPAALDRKYPTAATDWRWQWVFPQATRWKNTRTGEEGRHHIHATLVQRAVKEAVSRATISAPSRNCSATRTFARR